MAEATMAVAQILMLKSRFKRERRNCRADTDIVSMRRRREGVREKPNIPNANARNYLTNSTHSFGTEHGYLLIQR